MIANENQEREDAADAQAATTTAEEAAGDDPVSLPLPAAAVGHGGGDDGVDGDEKDENNEEDEGGGVIEGGDGNGERGGEAVGDGAERQRDERRPFYAVRGGRARGIFVTWEDCREQVEGYRGGEGEAGAGAGAEYGGFDSVEEALAYLRGDDPDGEKQRQRQRREDSASSAPPARGKKRARGRSRGTGAAKETAKGATNKPREAKARKAELAEARKAARQAELDGIFAENLGEYRTFRGGGGAESGGGAAADGDGSASATGRDPSLGSADPAERKLAGWVQKQRAEYTKLQEQTGLGAVFGLTPRTRVRGKKLSKNTEAWLGRPSTLTPRRIEMLLGAGFSFSHHRRRRDGGNGNGDGDNNGGGTGGDASRSSSDGSGSSPRQFALPRRSRTWEEQLQLLIAHRNSGGDVQDVPKAGPTADLRRWIDTQVQYYRGGKGGRLTADQRGRLEVEAGFVFPEPGRTKRDANWERRLAELAAYKELHGHTNVTEKEEGPLGKWVSWQRREYKKARLSADRIEQLDGLGFIFNRR